MVRRRRRRTSYRRRRHYQRGGILPFLIPLGLLAAKAAAAGAISGGMGYGVKKALTVEEDDERTYKNRVRARSRSIGNMIRRGRRRRRRRQRGGILPFLVPLALATGKAIAAGAVSGAAGYGVKKGLDAATRKKRVGKISWA